MVGGHENKRQNSLENAEILSGSKKKRIKKTTTKKEKDHEENSHKEKEDK